MATIDLSRSFQELIIGMDLRAALGPEFRDQLRTAHARGLLAAILREAGIDYKIDEPQSRLFGYLHRAVDRRQLAYLRYVSRSRAS